MFKLRLAFVVLLFLLLNAVPDTARAAAVIDAVEVTQAIQTLQTLADLQSALTANGQPPVAMVAGKPAVLRVYLKPVAHGTSFYIEANLLGQETQGAAIYQLPTCPSGVPWTPKNERLGQCRLPEFYFVPPEGDWAITINVYDRKAVPRTLLSGPLTLSFRGTKRHKSILLAASTICDARDPADAEKWLCAGPEGLRSNVERIKILFPTHSVEVGKPGINLQVRLESSAFPEEFFPDGRSRGRPKWWNKMLLQMEQAALPIAPDAGAVLDEQQLFIGIVRNGADPGSGIGGMAGGIPARRAAARESVTRLGTPVTDEVVAHELGHALGLKHTNTNVPSPAVPGVPPGCYSRAGDASTAWPFPDNRIRSESAGAIELGFDVRRRKPIQGDTSYELMSYCVPRWISAFSYNQLEASLRLANSAGPLSSIAQSTSQTWSFAGTIGQDTVGNPDVSIEPLYEELGAFVEPQFTGTETHRIRIVDANFDTLYSRYFTPSVARTETETEDILEPPVFAQLLPATPGAAALVIDDMKLGIPIAMTGVMQRAGDASSIRLLSPQFANNATLSGWQQIKWQLDNLHPDDVIDGTRVFYSPDGGSSGWVLLGYLGSADRALKVNFDSLPGSKVVNGQSLSLLKIEVARHDRGTGRKVYSPQLRVFSGQSAAGQIYFNVARKTPTGPMIQSPMPSSATFRANDLVTFSGSAFDVDDGTLQGNSISWTSDLTGPLGTGSTLTKRLPIGKHRVTMAAADSDGNVVRSATEVLVVKEPTATIKLKELGSRTPKCVEVTVSADADANKPLAAVDLSTDAGKTFKAIALGSLPYTFRAKTGSHALVARARDGATTLAPDQEAFDTAKFDSMCGPILMGRVTGWIYDAQTKKLSVSLTVTNNGIGLAKNISVNLTTRVLMGTGNAMPTSPPTPPFDLDTGQSSLLRLEYVITAPVLLISIAENGTFINEWEDKQTFSLSQSIPVNAK